MAPAPSQTSKLFTRDLAVYSDAELNKYLEANGGIVDVEDYENLRKDEVLIQRLRMLAHARGIAQSYPIDLDNLTARLEDISADSLAPPRPPSPALTEDLGEEEYYRLDLEEETECYNTLVNEGGRPSHPVSLGQDVLEDPGECREILSYWQLVNHDAEGRVWKVFGSQMSEWRRFRKWQRKNREEGRFPKHVDGVKQGLAEHGFAQPFQLDQDPERQDKLTTWIEFLDYEYWWYDKDMRFVKRHRPEYEKAWKELVDSQVLKPDETDEFICSTDSVFQRASEEERAGKAVKAAKFSVTSLQNAITDPRHSTLSENKGRQQLSVAQSRLATAVKSLESIKRRNDLVHEFYKKTQLSQITNDGKEKKSYQSAKEDAERRSILLRWILQQIPMIELELNQAKVAENDSTDKVNGRSCDRADELSKEQSSEKQERKRGRHDVTVDDELPSKRLRYDGQRSSSSGHKTYIASAISSRRSQESRASASRTARGHELASGKAELASEDIRLVESNSPTLNSSLSMRNNSPAVPSGPKIPNRRSARIAEREDRLRAPVVMPSTTVPRQRTAKLAQASIPPSTDSEERRSRLRATQIARKGRRKRDDRSPLGQQRTSKSKGRPRQ